MVRQPTAEDKAKIVDLFLDGNNVNHIVYLMNYEIRIDEVGNAIRDHLKTLRGALADAGQFLDNSDRGDKALEIAELFGFVPIVTQKGFKSYNGVYEFLEGVYDESKRTD